MVRRFGYRSVEFRVLFHNSQHAPWVPSSMKTLCVYVSTCLCGFFQTRLRWFVAVALLALAAACERNTATVTMALLVPVELSIFGVE